MKRFFTLYVPPFLTLVLVIIKIKEVNDWITKSYIHGAVFIGVIIFLCSALNHVITVISPFKKYEKIVNRKWLLLEHTTSKVFDSGLFVGHRILTNLMMPKMVFYTNLESWGSGNIWYHLKRFKNNFFRTILTIEWRSNTHPINKGVKFTAKQGASGRSFSQSTPILINVRESIDTLYLSEKQKKSISGNGFVLSCPVYAFDVKHSVLNPKKIIGVINFSCSTLEAEVTISNQQNQETLTEKILELSKVCSLIL